MNEFYVMQNVYVVMLPGVRTEFRLFLDPVEARNFFLDHEHADLFSFSVYQTQDGSIERSNMTRMSDASVGRMHTWEPLEASHE